MKLQYDPLVGKIRVFRGNRKDGVPYCDRCLRRKVHEFMRHEQLDDRLKREHDEFDRYGVVTYCLTRQQRDIADFDAWCMAQLQE